MAHQLFHLPRPTAISNNLTLVAGAKVGFFLTTTSTPTNSYQDSALTTPHTNPVVADAAGRLPAIYLDPDIQYRVTFTDAADVEIYPAIDPANDLLLTQAIFDAYLALSGPYKRTGAEIAAALTPTDYAVPSHEATGGLVRPSRYFNNAVPGTTDCTTILNTLADFCRANAFTLQLEPETWLFSNTLDFTGIAVQGTAGNGYTLPDSIPHLKCDPSADVHCILSEGNSHFRDFYIHGGSNVAVLGVGDLFHFVSPTNLCFDIHIDNVAGKFAKRDTIYWEGGAYSSIRNFSGQVARRHGLNLAQGVYPCTTVSVSGNSTFSSTQNGFGARIENGVSILFDGVILEDTWGILITGNVNRNLTFNSVYQENFTNPDTRFLTFNPASGSQGLTISNCIGIGRTISGIDGSSRVHIFGNAGIIEQAVPFAGRVVTADSGSQVTSTMAGSFTVASVVLPPGTWMINATMQTLTSTATGMIGAACALTTNAASSGRLITLDVDFAPGAAEAMYAPIGGQMDQRLNCFRTYENTTGGDVTMYLRGWADFSGAGNLGYRGVITATKLT
jgi:hypothetical protein